MLCEKKVFLSFLFWLVTGVCSQSCPSLVILSSGTGLPNCQPLDDCTGLVCLNSQRGRRVVFTVDSCRDPVLANVTVTEDPGGETILALPLTESLLLAKNDSYSFNWTMHRNASHLFVETTVTVSGTPYILVPYTAIALNTSYCMCQSIQDITISSQSQFESNCRNNSMCTGLDCSFSAGAILQFNVETELEQCAHPPGFVFIIREPQSNIILFEHYFDSSENVSFLSLWINVKVIHFDYSMIIAVDAIVSNQVFHVVPQSQVILDKTNCTKMGGASMTTPSIIFPTPVPVSSETCAKLMELAAVSLSKDCSVNELCNTVSCNTFGYRSRFQILPCHDPPGFHVILYDIDGSVFYNGIITNSTSIHLAFSQFNLLIVVRQNRSSSSLGFGIKIQTPFFTNDVVPYTEIPIDKCLCANAVCSSPSGLSATVAVEIFVPIGFLLICVLVSVFIIVILLYIAMKKRKTNSQFQFKQMSENNDYTIENNDYTINSEKS